MTLVGLLVQVREEDPLPLEGPVAGRARSVNALLGLASRGVRATAVRMPRTVHNEGKGGFAGLLTDQARRARVAGYPGDGTQRWPAVHALDAAILFRLALETAPAGRPGTPSPTRATRYAPSQRSSAGDSACRCSPYRKRTSARSARSSQWTSPPPAPALATPSGGSRPTPASSRTWRTFIPEALRPAPAGGRQLVPLAEAELRRDGRGPEGWRRRRAGRMPTRCSVTPRNGRPAVAIKRQDAQRASSPVPRPQQIGIIRHCGLLHPL